MDQTSNSKFSPGSRERLTRPSGKFPVSLFVQAGWNDSGIGHLINSAYRFCTPGQRRK